MHHMGSFNACTVLYMLVPTANAGPNCIFGWCWYTFTNIVLGLADLGITGAATNATELLYTAFPNSRDNIDLLLSLSTVTDNSDCVFVGDSILDYFKITRPFGQTAGILVAYLLVLHCLTYLALIFLAKKDKR